jgi:hypothetical protein
MKRAAVLWFLASGAVLIAAYLLALRWENENK